MSIASVETPQSCCRAGLVTIDITPPVGAYHRMWGAATHDRSTGVHRPLVATVLALEPSSGSAAERQILVALDHCLLWNRELQMLRASIRQAIGVANAQLHVTFSHTHAAGLIGLERASLPGGDLIGPYLDALAQNVAGAAREAVAALRSVDVVYGVGRCSLASHRDLWDADSNQYVCGFNPAGPTDDTVLVARLSDSEGRMLAAIVNYACHPTTLAWDNTLVSPDFVGALRDEVISAATAAPTLFLQGALGDLGPREGFVGDTAVADCNGRQLGYAALAALEALPPARTRFCYAGPVVSGATIGTWAHAPLDAAEIESKQRWRWQSWTVTLPYLDSLPTMDQAREQLADWTAKERIARQAGDTIATRDCRAQAERMTRLIVRLESLPAGKNFPLSVTLGQLGDVLWLFVESEAYNLLQRSLRERFPNVPLLVTTLTDGWGPGYLPTAETYGRGIYQESVSVVAPGCLELLIEDIAGRIAAWLA